jgi:hypothetical protein
MHLNHAENLNFVKYVKLNAAVAYFFNILILILQLAIQICLACVDFT